MIYEWSLHWNKKMGKFFTSQEQAKIENCKKQASREEEEDVVDLNLFIYLFFSQSRITCFNVSCKAF